MQPYNPRYANLGVKIAGVAQLVEHDVANVVVVGSSPITRSLGLSALGFRLSAKIHFEFWPIADSRQPIANYRGEPS